ncbi:type I secretion system permease/ATPase [Desulfobacter postgatei]|uniref:ABC-type protease/lipase transport system, ATPase and permease component n=1 Tax=Desulfobacter postgatei 2ac9 TaxID=879212 RepID=I5B1N3_9BACT|nr:ATP-binding cassette domain-containing protein [Desulfobacter postgatei]EIM63396.1 ABC-type protease/lipase transport system, ATPase and permease component [Desulfobacter postgatei 2ac9]
MQHIIKSWVKYFIIVGVFGLCMNLIYLALPIYMMVIYDKVLFSFSTASLSTLAAGIMISLVIVALIDYFRARVLGQTGNNLAQRMMPYVFKSMQADAAGIKRSGYTRGLLDLELLRDAFARGHILNFLDLPWVLVYLAVLYLIHPLLGFVSIGGVFLITLFQLLLKRIETKRYTVADVTFHAGADFAGNCLRHAQLISGMRMFSAAMEQYRIRYEKTLAARSEADAFHSAFGAVIRLLQMAVMTAVFTAGAFVFFSHGITQGGIFAGVMIIARLFYPFERSLLNMKTAVEAVAAYKRLKQFVNTRESNPKLSLPAPEGRVSAEAVSLSLDARTVLYNISLALEPGETLGVFGPSASGKTCLCKVLLGIWPPLTGKVRLDGAELSHWPEEELGQYLGYMPQTPELFPGTVAENISRFEVMDSEKIVKAAQKAGVHEMILKLPQGYETRIDQTGKNLAAGPRQLISLARALYGDPKFVVLDEPHTHLDDLGLRMVLTALKHLKQENVTTVMVSDRPNLIVNMDKLLMIKEGQTAMYGPAKEVLNQLANNKQSQQAAGV